MKKIFLLLFVLTLVVNVNAQQGAHVGLSSNFNTVWIVNQNSYGFDEFDYTLKLGGGAGLDVGYNFTDHIGVQSGFKTSAQGQSYEDSHHTGATRDYRTNYLCIPVLFKYTSGNKNVKFYFQAGPQFSFLNSAKITYKDAAGNSLAVEARDRFTKSDPGVNFGLGANINLTKYLYINAGMQFFYSFSDINSDEPKDASVTYENLGSGKPGPDGWRWPDEHGSGIYKASRNATGGLNVGVHYLFLRKK